MNDLTNNYQEVAYGLSSYVGCSVFAHWCKFNSVQDYWIHGLNMYISEELLIYISDADLQTKNEDIKFSTSIREIVTVEYMMEHHLKEVAMVGGS